MSVGLPLLGMALLLGTAVALSTDRRAISLRTVGGAFAIQVGLGLTLLLTNLVVYFLVWRKHR